MTKKILKADFIDNLSVKLGTTKLETETVLKSFTDLIMEIVAEGYTVNLVGFGKFYPITRKGRTGRDPRTGKIIQVLPIKSVHFTAGKTFRDKVKKS